MRLVQGASARPETHGDDIESTHFGLCELLSWLRESRFGVARDRMRPDPHSNCKALAETLTDEGNKL